MNRCHRIRRGQEQKCLASTHAAFPPGDDRQRLIENGIEQFPIRGNLFDIPQHHPAPVGLDAAHGLGRRAREFGAPTWNQQRLARRMTFDRSRRQGIGQRGDRLEREQGMAGNSVTETEFAAPDRIGTDVRIEIQQTIRNATSGGGGLGRDSNDAHIHLARAGTFRQPIRLASCAPTSARTEAAEHTHGRRPAVGERGPRELSHGRT